MSIDLPDSFDAPLGNLVGYDTPLGYNPGTVTTITGNEHVDLRTFDSTPVFQARPQSNLDAFLQHDLDANTQPVGSGGIFPYGQLWMEQVIAHPGEAWSLTSASGLLGGVTLGPIATRGNWRGLQLTCAGGAMQATLTSSAKLADNGGIDISNTALTHLSFVLPDYNTFNTATSTVQLCSNAAGDFASATSLVVPFSADVAISNQEFRLPISAFVTSGFSLGQVTGVRIVLKSATASPPALNQKITLLGLRAIQGGSWVPKTLDVNTQRGSMMYAVTTDGSDATAANAFVPLVRDDGSGGPTPIDGTLAMRFQTGLDTIATGSNFNAIDLIYRERRNLTVNPHTGSYIVARLEFNHSTTKVTTFVTTISGDYPGATITEKAQGVISYSTPPVLQPNKFYIFQGDLTNQTLHATIWTSNANGQFLTKVWDSATENNGSSAAYTKQTGRVGWSAKLIDRDVSLENFAVSATSFSVLRTKVFPSVTPVDGAQLTAACSGDINLFNNFQGFDLHLDYQTTLSGNYSWASSFPIFSNDFFIEDWSQTYVEYDIWVPGNANERNIPFPVLRSNDNPSLGSLYLTKPTVQPNQWNHVKIDLAELEGVQTGIFYTLWIEFASNSPTYTFTATPYTFFLDNVNIGRRTVNWQLRAQTNGVWREFRDVVNDPGGALHLPRLERGTELQLQAVALTQEAWISGFRLMPHYAELGRPTYYNP